MQATLTAPLLLPFVSGKRTHSDRVALNHKAAFGTPVKICTPVVRARQIYACISFIVFVFGNVSLGL